MQAGQPIRGLSARILQLMPFLDLYVAVFILYFYFGARLVDNAGEHVLFVFSVF
jgi:hypothetical protein